MVRRGVMLGEVISKIVSAFLPVYFVLALGYAIFYPVEAHVHGFGPALLDCVIYDA